MRPDQPPPGQFSCIATYDHFAIIRAGVVRIRNCLLFVLALVTPAVAPGETLKGVVKDSLDASISGALVFIHWDSAGSTVGLRDNIGVKADLRVRTKDDGTFSVDIPPGFYDVFVTSLAFTPACRKARIKPGGDVEITFRMNLDPLCTAEMGNRIEAVPPKP